VLLPQTSSVSDRGKCIVKNPAQPSSVSDDPPGLRWIPISPAQKRRRVGRRQHSGSAAPVNEISGVEEPLIHSVGIRPRERVVEIEGGMIPDEFSHRRLYGLPLS
jgi:hypothetical protein